MQAKTYLRLLEWRVVDVEDQEGGARVKLVGRPRASASTYPNLASVCTVPIYDCLPT